MSDQTLTTAQFSEFFGALWDKTPFPWQSALAERVLADQADAWPQAITLPTASGKTACLDIALFALAAQAGRLASKEPLTAPRRIFFVVDRRVIVDEAYDRAACMAMRLALAQVGILKEVADRLRDLAGGPTEAPLACFQLRGGIYRDDRWARSPIQPTIVCSTVDQVGSRLLFRAYGRSFKAWSLQAGLVGNDSLILLDEAHCAQPFMETLTAVARYRRWPETETETAVKSPFHFVIMTATPPTVDAADHPSKVVVRFPDAATEKANREHPVLKRRIEATKPCRLVIADKAHGKDAAKLNQAMADKLVAEATRLIKEAPTPKSDTLNAASAPAVAILCNRVDTARRAHAQLIDKHGERAVLLIGRMRPLDKDDTVDRSLAPLSADVSQTRQLDEPRFVVATQTLEVGANLDFDLMVSECADLSALRQRFGRLNRMGRPIQARGVIVVRADQQKRDGPPDPIYGDALSATWTWLSGQSNEHGDVDLGIAAFEKFDIDALASLARAATHAPVLLPAHVDALAQTAPEPSPSPEISLFLHGPQPGLADVQVCWRADLSGHIKDDQARETAWIETLTLCPPASGELMSVPLMTFRRWLVGESDSAADLGDVEGIASEAEPPSAKRPRSVLRWRGLDDTGLIQDATAVRPGDLFVIPAEIGGWETFGHVPPEAAKDLGDRAHFNARAKAVLRLTAGTLADWPEPCPPARQTLLNLLEDAESRIEDDPGGLASDIKAALLTLAQESNAPNWVWLRDIALQLAQEDHLERCITPHPCGGLVLKQRKPPRTHCGAGSGFSHEDDATASGTVHWPLDTHLQGVAEFAARFTAHLPAALSEDIQLAAIHHDLGKADPRFQALLHGGNPWVKGPLLAKSADMPQGRDARRAALKASGYPRGGRHELLSVRLLESAQDRLAMAHDQDLVKHLIASHHGFCRPFAPVVDDLEPREVPVPINGCVFRSNSATLLEHLNGGVPERFWRLTRRYGWWGLAWLEAMMMLADHRRSEWEECQASGDPK